MKPLKILTVLLLLILFGCCKSTKFKYKIVGPLTEDADISAYSPPDADLELETDFDDDVHNVILLIGDGMGFNHVELARAVVVADKGLWMEQLPVKGQLTTYAANKKVTDSAASGTAMACGIKTNNGMIGMDPKEVQYRSILELLSVDRWKTGLVATSQITHATPASFASHVKSRGNQKKIALQMLANRVDVMLGGGRKYWLPKEADGIRNDGRNLLEKAQLDGYRVIELRDELLALEQLPALGLFGKDGLTTFNPEPMLGEMCGKAIELLAAESKKRAGFFLMVEGSQIDWAAHANDTNRVIRQTLLFDLAVREAIQFARRDKHTLVIVTADHETGGLKLKTSKRNNSIKAKWTSGGHTAVNVPIYAYGPGSQEFAGTIDNTDIAKCIAKLTGIKVFPIKKTESQ